MEEEEAAYSKYEKEFKKGSIVEVSSEDEGMRGSWYTATVIRTISRKTHKILVEYHNLMADDAGSKPLREYVAAILIRPIPPREPQPLFSPMDDVDAFHNDGWWEGVVTNVTTTTTSSSSSSFVYSVFFRCSREQIDFCSSDLRLHREWVPLRNLWVPPLDLDIHASSPGQRKRSGEGGINRYHLSGEKDKGVKRNGGRRISGTPTKLDGFVKKGRCQDERKSSNHSVNSDMVHTIWNDEKLKLSSNGICTKHGLTGYVPENSDDGNSYLLSFKRIASVVMVAAKALVASEALMFV